MFILLSAPSFRHFPEQWYVSSFLIPLLCAPSYLCAQGLPSSHGDHRITGSLRLEKTSKIIKSNRQPITTMPAKPCPEVPHLHVCWTPPGMVTPPLPQAAKLGRGACCWPEAVQRALGPSCCRSIPRAGREAAPCPPSVAPQSVRQVEAACQPVQNRYGDAARGSAPEQGLEEAC